MRISTSIIHESIQNKTSIWPTTIKNGTNFLDNIIKTLQKTALFTDISVFTNDTTLTNNVNYKSIPVHSFDQELVYNFNYLDNIKLHNECLSLERLGVLGDIHLFIDLRYQLLSPSSLLSMFNTLMENRFAAKVIPVSMIDPHLYMEIPGNDQFMNIWGQQGLDRQKHPSLFRTIECCLIHCARIKEMQPLTFPLEIGRIEGFKFQHEKDISFLKYIMEKKSMGTQ
jgi:hypothetical protein